MKVPLYEEEDYQLRHDYTHEHRERVDRGVTYGGSIVVGDLVAVSECRGSVYVPDNIPQMLK